MPLGSCLFPSVPPPPLSPMHRAAFLLIQMQSLIHQIRHSYLAKKKVRWKTLWLGRLTVASDTVIPCLRGVDVIFWENIDKVMEGRMTGRKVFNLIPPSSYISLCTRANSTKFVETYVELRVLFHYKFKK